MRRSIALISTVIAAGVLAACDGSSTEPARCDVITTTASYVDGAQLTGIVTSMILANGSSASSPVWLVHVDVHDNPDFTIYFTVTGETPVFERTGSAPPTASSLCRLDVGQKVQVPSSTFADGFGDHPPVSGNELAPQQPPDVGQIVIVR
ncbi:MAG TPA: hypothetical protein VGO46_17590 [Gemmatimonadaceae bacterium]|nr:hypothetical protein [Gemmatimonadaceae bacterium]